MKSNFKKLLAAALAMLLVFSLTACRRQIRSGDVAPDDEDETVETTASDPAETTAPADPAEPTERQDSESEDRTPEIDEETAAVIGEWTADVSAGAFLNSGLREAVGETSLNYFNFEDIAVHVRLTLRSDFSYTLELDKDAYEQTKQNIIETLRAGFIKLFVDQTGLSEDDLRKALSITGENLDDNVEEKIEQTTDIEGILGTKMTGYFKYEDGKLYYTVDDAELDPNQFAIIQINVGEITVVEMSEEGKIHIDKAFLPIIFRKG